MERDNERSDLVACCCSLPQQLMIYHSKDKMEGGKDVPDSVNQLTCVCCVIRRIPSISLPASVSVDSQPPTA